MNYKNNRSLIRNQLFTEQKTCIYCNCSLEIENNKSLNFATIEHIVPQSKDGSQLIDNLTLACPTCNSLRSSQDNFVGFYFKTSTFFESKEDISKVLQFINLQKNISFYNYIKKMVKNKSIKQLQDFLNINKEMGIVRYILKCILKDFDIAKVLNKIYNFLTCVLKDTEKLISDLLKIINKYDIELVEFTVFEYGLVKQTYKGSYA